MEYNLITLNPQEMLKRYDVIKTESANYAIDYNYDFIESPFLDNLIVDSIDSFEENALFYQMKKTLHKEGARWDENSLQHHILYIDFNEIFKGEVVEAEEKTDYKEEELLCNNASIETKLRFLFNPNYGVKIRFKNGDQKTFVPFDKSSSMARNCRITFIDCEIKEELDSRLQLDFNFQSIQMVLSKFYAYRGLYLTSAHRISSDERFKLNAETVIVLSDDKNTIIDKGNKIKLFKETYREKDEHGEIFWQFGEKTAESKDLTITPFDGEGIISKRYAHLINKRLGKYGYHSEQKPTADFSSEASTFQIRMPFTKGVLHAVDFNGFISEYVTNDESIWIKDIFGIPRDLRKAEIILTESMFKAHAWMEAIWLNEGHSLTADDDIMKHYFDKMDTYDHALYVGNTNISLSSTDVVKMNYQFLNTLDITKEEFEELVVKHNSQTESVKELFLNDIDDMSDDFETQSIPVWKKSLYKNRSFLHNNKVRGLLNGTKESLLLDCALGKIRVKGECRFLSCDLLAFLIFITKKIENSNFEEKFRNLSKETLFADRFFMPNEKISLSPDKYYGILRNPHLSRNEQVMLRPYIAKKDSVYDKYFSHLSGIVMLSRNSLAPNTLSGADFDGDLVKIVSQEEIVEAIKRGTYEKDKNGFTRKLAIIDIPKTTAIKETDKGSITYKIIKNTFSNSIGQISNLAIRIGEKEYFENDPKLKNKCAECTIVTGIEIDAAKTGLHPKKNIEALNESLDTNNKDYFLEANEVLSSLGKDRFFITLTCSGDNITLKRQRGKKALLSIEPKDDRPNIYKLPYFYAKEKMKQLERKDIKETDETASNEYNICFNFQMDEKWKSKLDSDLKKEVRLLVSAYYETIKFANRIYNHKLTFSKTKYSDFVLTILKIQYDSMNSPLPCGISVDVALDSTFSFISEKLIQASDAENALNYIIEKKWFYANETEREDILFHIFTTDKNEINTEIVELLTNFNNNGYNLLYYILHHIINEKLKNFTPELFEERERIKGKSEDLNLQKNKYYKDLYHIYCDSANKGEKKKIWKKLLVDFCKSKLESLFNNNLDIALRYVIANDSSDKNSDFLWDVIPEETILSNIYDEE